MNKNCSNCFHAQKSETELNQYFCIRYPPTPIPVQVPQPGCISVQINSVYPPVTSENICSEHEIKLDS